MFQEACASHSFSYSPTANSSPSSRPFPATTAGRTFGTPSYPSPLDRIRTGKRTRAQELGLDVSTARRRDSYEFNQSFPKAAGILHKAEEIGEEGEEGEERGIGLAVSVTARALEKRGKEEADTSAQQFNGDYFKEASQGALLC